MINSKPNFFEKPINGKYTIIKKLKSGGFGSVYIARDIKVAIKQYAIKLMPKQAKNYADIQLCMYELIQKQKFTYGFIKYYENGEFMNHRYLLMELIGKDLQEVMKKSPNDRFTTKSVLMLGLQVVDRLEAIHKIGYIHRDVKPDNLAIGINQKGKIIYLFDFGLSLKIGSEIPKEEKGKVVGTIAFMSCRAHQGRMQGPADDIQSLIYTLLYLSEGSLPWLKLQIKSQADFHKIFLAKKGLTKKSFKNQKISNQLFQILQFIKKYKHTDKVDYLQIKYKLIQGLKQIGEKNDFQFDWLSETQRKKQPLSPLKKREVSPQEEIRQNKKLQIMNEENQQIVQNQIYEVYKFIKDKNEPRKDKRSKSKSPKKDIKPKEQPKVQNKIRPFSAVTKPKRQVKPNMPQWQRIYELESANSVSGPRIVINKTAKHKI